MSSPELGEEEAGRGCTEAEFEPRPHAEVSGINFCELLHLKGSK